MKPKELLLLLLLTLAALFIHGYHPYVEDAEIYVPGIEKLLHPELFPFNAQFFEPHAHSTLFRNLIATSVRLTHLRLESALFIWHLLSIFLLLLACWQLSARCFADSKARWAGVALITALLTLPIAGTSLYVMDQYINPRNLSAFAIVFAIVRVLDEKYVQAALFLIFAAVIHPLMAVFAISLCAVLLLMKSPRPALAALLPFGLTLDPPPQTYHLVALNHSYFYLTRWHWYELLGAIGPMVILWWFVRIAHKSQWRNMELLCRATIIYELIYLPIALLLSIPARFEALARLQPMRCLYLVYVVMLLIGGGLLGEFVLKNRLWRWLALFVPLCVGMFLAQQALFPTSAHIEWPGSQPRNPWVQAFRWVRNNTPNDAIFALDPTFMGKQGEDEQGFRAIARRSRTADELKDSGAVSMFPTLADDWAHQVHAQQGWQSFQLKDFRRLQQQYGVNWIVVQQPAVPGLECPYHNPAVSVCRLWGGDNPAHGN